MKNPLAAIRKARLAHLIVTQFSGSQADFAEAVDKKPAYVSFLLNDRKTMGEALARQMEKRLKLPPFWFDQPLGDDAKAPLSAGQLEVREAVAKYLVRVPDGIAHHIAKLIISSAQATDDPK